MKNPTLIIICGPTATGKTEVAFDVAKKLKTEIISFDSVQIYKELDIGAAKPSLEFRQEIPHHLIDEVNPDQLFTAGDFRKQALDEIAKLSEKKYIVLVGGTGFYLQALIKGMYEIPSIDPQIKINLIEESKLKGMDSLYAELVKKDPAYAKRIHPNDSYRILRGLEVLRSGSKSLTKMREEFKSAPLPNKIVQIGLRRKKEILRQVVESRTECMIASGLIEETSQLLKKYPQGIRPLESVGYKEAVKFISGELTQGELLPTIVTHTLQLAKRQYTWFKRDPAIKWFDPDEMGVDPIVEGIVRLSLDNSS